MDKQSAPRTNAAIAAALDRLLESDRSLDGWRLTLREAADALRKEQHEGVPCTDCGQLITDPRDVEIKGDTALHFNCTAALRNGPPALPAEVEAVVAKLARLRFFLNDDERWPSVGEAATLLRRYAQAVAEKDGIADLGLRLCDERDDACTKLAAAEAEIARLRGVVRRGRDKISDLIDANLGADDKQTVKRLAAQHIATAMKDGGLCEWAQIIGETER